MSMSVCIKCWSTPCECGYEYLDWELPRLIKMRNMFQKLIDSKESPNKPIWKTRYTSTPHGGTDLIEIRSGVNFETTATNNLTGENE